MSNYGLLIEDEMSNALNKKKFKDLSNNLRTFIRDIFGVVNEKDKIYCSKVEGRYKPDIAVRIKDKTKFVSIKSGRATTMHEENIKEVVLFLRSLGLSVESQKLFLYYHFGDGTLDGSGAYRRDYHDTYEWLRNQIKAFNDEVNSNDEMKLKIIERVMFQGISDLSPRADYIYQGDINYGLVISRVQIIKHLMRKTFNFYENVHIGPLLIRPHARYAGKEVKNDELRRRVDFYWPNFAEDVRYIYNRYDKPYNDK